MNSIWNKNYALFRNRFPQLSQSFLPQKNAWEAALQKAGPSEDGSLEGGAFGTAARLVGWALESAKNGSPTATENGLRLHSVYNPQREAQSAVLQKEVAEKGTCVFLGFALGYHLVEYAKSYPSKKLVIIEPDVNRLFASMELLDWTDIFKMENIVLAVACPEDQIIHLIEDTSKITIEEKAFDNVHFFDIPAFTNHAKQYFENIRTLIKRNKTRNQINAATLKKFGRLWCKNTLKNLHFLTENASIQGLRDGAKDDALPFLVVGAGPSLERILPFMKELSKRTIVVCVETALHALQKEGVQPDFIILTDPQFWAYRHIAGLKAPQSILITEVCAYPAVFRFECEKTLLCKSQFPVGAYFEEQLQLDLGDLGAGGSVISSAWNFAHFCGAREVYFAGADFGFPQGQTHIKGSTTEQARHSVSDRLKSVEQMTLEALCGANIQTGTDYLGKPVATDSRMKMFAWWFESRLAACPETKTFTLCPQSLCIPGIAVRTVDELMNKAELLGKKTRFLEKALSAPPCISKENKTALQEFYDLQKSFPTPDFLERYEFLAEYLR